MLNGILNWLVPMAYAAEGDPDPDSGAAGEPEPEPKVFTQAELNAQITKRLQRQQASAEKKLRESLGLAAADDIDEALASLRERAARAVDDDDDPPKGNDKLERKVQQLTAQVESTKADLTRQALEQRQRLESRLIESAVLGAFAGERERLTADGAVLLEPILRKRLAVDEESLEVIPVDESGDRAMSNGKELQIGDVVAELMIQFPSVVRAPQGGSGASRQRPAPSSAIAAAQAAHRENPTRQTQEALTAAVLAGGSA